MDASTIIGIGTARGGTQSLAYLLQQQGLDVTHEGTRSIDWRREVRERRYHETRRYLESCDGDVACWLLQAASDLLGDIEGSVVVSVRRGKEDTVESLIETMGEGRIRQSETFEGMPFPTYEGPIEEAWASYWQDFRQRVGTLKQQYSDRVFEVELGEIEDEDAQSDLAEFLGIEDWEHVSDCHKGARPQ